MVCVLFWIVFKRYILFCRFLNFLRTCSSTSSDIVQYRYCTSSIPVVSRKSSFICVLYSVLCFGIIRTLLLFLTVSLYPLKRRYKKIRVLCSSHMFSASRALNFQCCRDSISTASLETSAVIASAILSSLSLVDWFLMLLHVLAGLDPGWSCPGGADSKGCPGTPNSQVNLTW